MSNFFELLNSFSQTPTLKINGNVRPFSIFASIIGFLLFTILITVNSYIIYQYFSRLNYTFNSYVDNLFYSDIDKKILN
jgi:hypothetical protein